MARGHKPANRQRFRREALAEAEQLDAFDAQLAKGRGSRARTLAQLIRGRPP